MIAALLVFATLLQHNTHANHIQVDTIPTSAGQLTISFIGHGSLMFEIGGTVIHVDPWTKLVDYSKLPKADIILITHHHPDHLDTNAISALLKTGTHIVLTQDAYNILGKGTIMKNGDSLTIDRIKIEAVPAYNTTAGREQFHPKGRDNGYVLRIGNTKIYVAGDTEDIPEMALLKDIDIAFLPMNQPYTMTPEEVAAAVYTFRPHILYPYHYGETDVSKLTKLLSRLKHVEVRVRRMN